MRNVLSRRRTGCFVGSGLALLLLILATPRPASAYVDPGSGAMLWQAAAAACIGSLFYMRKLVLLVRRHVDFRAPRAMGFAFATAYALVAAPLACSLFRHGQTPRFSDLFLPGIMLTVYFFTWEGATYLVGIGALASAWVLSPDGTLAVRSPVDLYRLTSFTLVSLFLIALITRLKTGSMSPAGREGAQ